MIDIYDIQRYTNYTIDTTITAEDLMKQVIIQAQTYLDAPAIQQIWKAFEFAKQAHAGVFRLSGEPYITHPVHATIFLMNIRPDLSTIQACLMHDVIEDTDVTYDDIAREFWSDVAWLCQSMVKVGKIKYRGEERNLETWKKTFLAMAEDIRVIFIKLVDRIHNTQTLKFHPNPDKIKRIATETLHIHASIAKRLWLHDFQLLLENGSYAMLEPEQFGHVIEHMIEFYTSEENYIQTWIDKLSQVMSNDHVPVSTIKGRMKSPYRVAQKVFDPQKPYDMYSIHDVIAFRIIVPTISDCYLALWSVHGSFAPELSKIKDFIARPLENWYQSLHTRVFGLLPFQTEVQIRTQDMDLIAEYGVAAHFAYAESWSKSIPTSLKQWQRIKKMQDIVKQYQEDFDWFKEQLNIELIDQTIFVYTPKWDVIELSRGATILDFAFRIHSKVWLSYRNGIVDGRIVPIDYILQNWQTVHIITWNNKESITPTWLNYVTTSQAKQAINKHLRASQKPLFIKSAIEIINQKLHEYELPALWHPDSLIKQHIESLEWSLLQVYEKQITAYHRIKQYYPHIQQQTHHTTDRTKDEVSNHSQSIVIDWQQLEYTCCGECKPSFPDKIIAKSGSHGIKIHQVSCTSLQSISYNKLLECHRWDVTDNWTIYEVTFALDMSQKHEDLSDIMSIFKQLWIAITHIHIEPLIDKDDSLHHQWYTSRMTLIWECTIPSKIHYIIKHITSLSATTIYNISIR